MKKGDFNSKGFTIIEVSLVLAIAGLIFLMVFIALPALQRQQRDTARTEDVNALVANIKKYQMNNRGALPIDVSSGTNDTIVANDGAAKNTWAGFLREYMTSGFEDPSGGESYKIVVLSCGTNAVDADCPNASEIVGADFPNGYKMYVLKEAKCSGNDATGAVKVANPRRVAILYKREGGGVICANT